MVSPALVTCYDAVSIDTIPGSPAACLGYVDVWDEQTGRSNYQSVRERWPEAIVVPITVSGTHELTYDGKRVRMCDSESGDLSSAGAAQWCYEELELGAPSWGEVIPWYMAWWNGVPDLAIPRPPWPVLPAPVGHQYYREGEFTYDMSVVLKRWLMLPAPPTPYCQSANGLSMQDALAAVGLRMGEPPPPQPKEPPMATYVRNPGPKPVIGAGDVAIEAGAICEVSPAGAVNQGASWSEIEEWYAANDVPLPLFNDPVLLGLYAKIAYHPYPA